MVSPSRTPGLSSGTTNGDSNLVDYEPKDTRAPKLRSAQR
jgi:hypothetical protein